MLKQLFTLIFIACWGTIGLWAQSADESAATTLFNQANSDFAAGRFAEAVANYEKITNEAHVNAFALQYNLGEAHFRLNHLAEAAWHFEKAALLEPNDADVQHNLKVLNARLVDRFNAIEDFFLMAWWKSLRASLSATVWAGLFILMCSIAAISWAMKLRNGFKQGTKLSLAALVLAVLTFMLAMQRHNLASAETDYAILFAKETQLLAAPDAQSTSLNTLHEGVKLKIVDSLSGFVKVRLPNGEEGWLKQEEMRRI